MWNIQDKSIILTALQKKANGIHQPNQQNQAPLQDLIRFPT